MPDTFGNAAILLPKKMQEIFIIYEIMNLFIQKRADYRQNCHKNTVFRQLFGIMKFQ